MVDNINQAWEAPYTADLVSALIDIKDADIMKKFMRDVMTEKELTEISARLQAAKMLMNGSKYSDIVNATKLSSRTVARIADWISNGSGGYQLVLNKSNHDHILPARAD